MWEAITVIEAQDQLKKLSLMDWPNLKKDKRQKLHKELSSKAYPSSMEKSKKSISPKDLQRILSGGPK